MALSLVGTNFRWSQDQKGVHRRNRRKVQDGGPRLESGRRRAADDQRGDVAPRSGSLLWHPRPFPDRSETGRGRRTNYSQYSSLLPKYDLPAHPTQVGRQLSRRRSARFGTGLASQARTLAQVQGTYSIPDVSSFRQGDALGIAECGTKPHGLGRSEGHQQAQETSSHPSGKGCLAIARRAGSALSNHRANWLVFRFANQRNPGFALDGFRFQAIGGSGSTISRRKAAQQVEDGVFAGRGSNRTGLYPRTQEMASALSRYRRALAFPEPGDGSTVSCRLDAQRLPGSYGSETGTGQNRVSHVPSHVSCLAGRDRSTRGRTAETHATRARFHHDGPVRQCLGLGQAQSQSPNRATPLAKASQSRGLYSINKGNCVTVPLIGQFWTVAGSRQYPVTL